MARKAPSDEAAAKARRSAAARKAAATRARNRAQALLDAAAQADVDAVRGWGRHRAAAEKDIARLAAGNAHIATGLMAETIRGAADALDGDDVKPGERSTLMNTVRRSLAHLEQASAEKAAPKRDGLSVLLSDDADAA